MKTNFTKWLMLTGLSFAMLLIACGKKDSGGGAPNSNSAFVNCATCAGIIGNADQYIGSVKGSSPNNMDVRLDIYGDSTRMVFSANPNAMNNYMGPVAVVATVNSTGAANIYGGCNLYPGTSTLYSIAAAELRNGALFNVRVQGVMPNNVLVTMKLTQGTFYTQAGVGAPVRDTVVGGDYNMTQNRIFSDNLVVESISNLPCAGAYTIN